MGKPARANDRLGRIVIFPIAVPLVGDKLLFNSRGVFVSEIVNIESLNDDIHVAALGSQLLECVHSSRLFLEKTGLSSADGRSFCNGRNQNRDYAAYFYKTVTDATSL